MILLKNVEVFLILGSTLSCSDPGVSCDAVCFSKCVVRSGVLTVGFLICFGVLVLIAEWKVVTSLLKGALGIH